MNKKRLITMLATITILTALISPMLFVSPVKAQDPEDWYMTVSGVLDSDYYALYPYENKSLTIGFSKFGEMIQYNWTSETGIGLEYDGTDPFANEIVDVTDWMEGWFMDIKYTHPVWGNREIWAFALFSDATEIGGEWTTVPEVEFDDPLRPYWQEWPPFATPAAGTPGGRKTNGYATTDPIEVLYDGPRRFVALLHTRLSDLHLGAKKALVDLYITVIFNKVKKTLLLLKDIKRIPKYDLDIEFSERGEWDLGPGPSSYVHFYTGEEAEYTCYGSEWHLDTIPHSYAVAQVISSDEDYVAAVAHWPHPDFWTVDGIDYMVWPISRMNEWEDWDVDSGHLYPLPVNVTNTVTQVDDVGATEPTIPWIIGENSFTLRPEVLDLYRVATAYVLTDYNDALDDDMTGVTQNVIDREIMYQLDETFNPWDLVSAVHKDASRWVEFFTGDGETTNFRLTEGVLSLQTYNPGGAYDGVIQWQLDEDLPFRGCKKSIEMRTTNKTFADDTTVDQGCAIAYSVNMTVAEFEEFVYHFWLPEGRDATPEPSWPPHMCFYLQGALDPTQFCDVSLMPSNIRGEHAATTEEWVEETITASSPGFNDYGTIDEITNHGTTNELLSFFFDQCPNARIVWISIEFGGWGAGYDDGKAYVDDVSLNGVDLTPKRGELVYDENSYTAEQLGETPEWDKYCSFAERVLVDGVLQVRGVDYTIDIAEKDETYWDNIYSGDPTLEFVTAPAEDAVIKVLYSTKPEGSYEWTVVGRDSAAVDSAGAAMVSAYFKNKHIEPVWSGIDIDDLTHGPNVPCIFRNLTGPIGDRANYNDALGREALLDDWCTACPISSSNIIVVGGPYPNLAAEYFNEFTDAFIFSTLGDGILALTCWDRNFYPAGTVDDDIGHAIISTYKDINGTIGFIVWGWTGQDTWAACAWFVNYGYMLQELNDHVTTIVLEFDFSIHGIGWDIVEYLGTISEKEEQHDC